MPQPSAHPLLRLEANGKWSWLPADVGRAREPEGPGWERTGLGGLAGSVTDSAAPAVPGPTGLPGEEAPGSRGWLSLSWCAPSRAFSPPRGCPRLWTSPRDCTHSRTHGRPNPVRSYLSEGLASPCSPPPSSLGFSKCNHGAHAKRGSSLCLLVRSRMAHHTLHGRVGSGEENRVRQNNE